MATDTIGQHILDNAGINSSSRRNSFRERYPDAEKLYADTYNSLDDEALKAKFLSSNRKEAHAALLASRRMAEQHRLFVSVGTDNVQSAIANASFKEEYEIALKQIENNEIDTSRPEALAAFTLDDLKTKRASKPAARQNVMSIVRRCRVLNCTFEAMTFNETKHNEVDGRFFGFDGILSERSGKIGTFLREPVPMVSNPPKLILKGSDLQGETPEYHTIAGKLDYWARELNISASGSCDSGMGHKCPTVSIKSDDTKFNLTMGVGGVNALELPNTDAGLKHFRLYPPQSESFGDGWRKYKALLLDSKSLTKPATYHLSVLSHEPSAPFAGFAALVHVYRPIIFSFSATVAIPIFNNGDFECSVGYLARIDDKELQGSHSADPKTFFNEVFNNVTWPITLITSVSRILKGMSHLNRGHSDDIVDGAEPQPLDATNEAPAEDGKKTESDLMTSEFTLAYRRILAPKPDGSGVGYMEQVFFAATPLLTYSHKTTFTWTLWQACLAAATGGASEIAQQTFRALGIEEMVTDGFHNLRTWFQQVAKDIKKLSHVSDEDVEDIIAKPNQSPASFGAKISFEMEFSGAIETDSPGAGLVFHKPLGASKWSIDGQSTSLYGGVNAQFKPSCSLDLSIVKAFTCGVGPDSAGIDVTVQSADNCAPVRLAVNVSGIQSGKEVSKADTAKLKQLKLDSDKGDTAAEDALKDAVGKLKDRDEAGVGISLLFSGIGVFITAYIRVTKTAIEEKSTKTEYDDHQASGRSNDVPKRKLKSESNGLIQKQLNFKMMRERRSRDIWRIPSPFK